MLTYQFSTEMNANGELAVPEKYMDSIPSGSKLQVFIVVEPQEASTNTNGTDSRSTAERSSLQALVEEIRNTPLRPELITSASGLLGKHLAESLEQSVPAFDEEVWNREWDQIEAEMDADALANETKRLLEVAKDLGQ